MFKGIVFDLDGTLVDSPLCFKTMRKQLGVPEGEYILEYLECLPDVDKKIRLKRLEEIEFEAAQKAFLFPGVRVLLSEIRHGGIHVGIFTRNCKLATNHIVESFSLPIDKIITRDDAPPKPDPAGLRKFFEKWMISQRDLLYVGDSRFDIECGKKGGVATALFTNGKTLEENLNPDFIVTHYSKFWQTIKLKTQF